MDQRAAEQIERLFHATDSRVWDLAGPEQSEPSHSIVIRDEDGTPVAYAHPPRETRPLPDQLTRSTPPPPATR